jgi:hypothetical protein
MMYEQEIVHTLYKKLLTLYPQTFKEQLGESMERTFQDLWNEKRQTKKEMFGFVLWTFIETAIGIFREHLLLISPGDIMQTILKTLGSPVLISLLLILPFMIMEVVNRQNFNEGFPVPLFIILWLGLTAILFILTPIVRNIWVRSNDVANPLAAQGNTLLTNPGWTAVISFILALPFMMLLSMLLLDIEPPFAHLLDNPNPDQPDVLGSLIVVGTFLLAVVACIIARVSIMRALQAGRSLFAHPINLVLALVIFSFITMFVAGLIIDQMPCFLGVPNCD